MLDTAVCVCVKYEFALQCKMSMVQCWREKIYEVNSDAMSEAKLLGEVGYEE